MSFQIQWKRHLLQEAFPHHTFLNASPLCSCSILCREATSTDHAELPYTRGQGRCVGQVSRYMEMSEQYHS